MNTKITKWGNSYGIRVPKSIVEELDLKQGEEFSLIVKDRTLSISPVVKNKLNIVKYDLKTLLKDFDPKTRHEEFYWGPDVGREIFPPYNPNEI